jgi:REP element-mobilizing transposase RayT
MANTYSQINLHIVFAVKGRENIIVPEFRDDLCKYLAGILKNHNAFPLSIGGWYDHVHIFF